MCINFFSFFILSSLLSPLFFFLFVSLSLRCSALSPSVSSQQLGGGGGGCGLLMARWRGCGLVVFSDGLFPDLLVIVVRGGDGVSIWVCRR
jgi:hypothetical protein